MAGERLRVGVNIAEDSKGRKFYNLNQDLEGWALKNEPPGVARETKRGDQGARQGSDKATLESIIVSSPAAIDASQDASDATEHPINLFILPSER